MAKRYYWLKLPDDFFRQKPIKKLRKIAGGDTYTIIYLKMLLIAIKQDGKIYFGAGTFKDVYAQLKADPHIEISANKGLEFIRYYGKAVMVDDDALVEKAFEVMPNLKKIYNEETGYKLGMFYIDEATVEFRRLITLNEKIEL